MKRIFKLFSLLSCITVFTFCIIGVKQEKVTTPVRDVELSCQSLEVDSSFKEFEDYELQIDEQCVNFIGYNDISLSDLEELDLISSDDISDNTTTKYTCMYDYENGIVSLRVSLVSNEEISIIDTMHGVIIMDEEENFDVVFDCEGATLLLSELEESGVLENCGFWSKLKKVWNSTAGKIGTIVTVATCAVVGVVCAVVPGGQLVTATLIGAAVGAIGGAVTAGLATYLEDGTIDWGAVGSYALAGGVVGAVVSGVTFKVATIIKGVTISSTTSTPTNINANIGNKLDYAFGKSTGNAHNIQRSMTMKSQLSKIGIYDDVAGRQMMTNFMNQTLNSNLSTIVSTTERVAVDSLLAGPNGFLQVRTIWEGTKLITFIFFG